MPQKELVVSQGGKGKADDSPPDVEPPNPIPKDHRLVEFYQLRELRELIACESVR